MWNAYGVLMREQKRCTDNERCDETPVEKTPDSFSEVVLFIIYHAACPFVESLEQDGETLSPHVTAVVGSFGVSHNVRMKTRVRKNAKGVRGMGKKGKYLAPQVLMQGRGMSGSPCPSVPHRRHRRHHHYLHPSRRPTLPPAPRVDSRVSKSTSHVKYLPNSVNSKKFAPSNDTPPRPGFRLVSV